MVGETSLLPKKEPIGERALCMFLFLSIYTQSDSTKSELMHWQLMMSAVDEAGSNLMKWCVSDYLV